MTESTQFKKGYQPELKKAQLEAEWKLRGVPKKKYALLHHMYIDHAEGYERHYPDMLNRYSRPLFRVLPGIIQQMLIRRSDNKVKAETMPRIVKEAMYRLRQLEHDCPEQERLCDKLRQEHQDRLIVLHQQAEARYARFKWMPKSFREYGIKRAYQEALFPLLDSHYTEIVDVIRLYRRTKRPQIVSQLTDIKERENRQAPAQRVTTCQITLPMLPPPQNVRQ